MSSKKKLKARIKKLEKELAQDNGGMDLVGADGELITSFNPEEASHIIEKSVNLYLRKLLDDHSNFHERHLEGLLRRWVEARVAFDPYSWKTSQRLMDSADEELFNYAWSLYSAEDNSDNLDRYQMVRAKILSLSCALDVDDLDMRATIQGCRKAAPELWRRIDDVIATLES